MQIYIRVSLDKTLTEEFRFRSPDLFGSPYLKHWEVKLCV